MDQDEGMEILSRIENWIQSLKNLYGKFLEDRGDLKRLLILAENLDCSVDLDNFLESIKENATGIRLIRRKKVKALQAEIFSVSSLVREMWQLYRNSYLAGHPKDCEESQAVVDGAFGFLDYSSDDNVDVIEIYLQLVALNHSVFNLKSIVQLILQERIQIHQNHPEAANEEESFEDTYLSIITDCFAEELNEMREKESLTEENIVMLSNFLRNDFGVENFDSKKLQTLFKEAFFES